MIKNIIDKFICSKVLIPLMSGIALVAFWLVLFPNGEIAVFFVFFISGLILSFVRFLYWVNSIDKKWELGTASDFDIYLYTTLTDEGITWLGIGIAIGLIGSIILKYLQLDSHPTLVLILACAIVIGNIGRATAWNNKGIALLKLEKYQEAIECFDKAIKITGSSQAWSNKGEVLKNFGKNHEAIECCDKAIKLNPKNFLALTNKGSALGNLGKQQEAIECYDKSLEINPNCDLAWTDKGVALVKLEKYQEAIECCDKALEINPRNFVAWNNKGDTLKNLGKYKEAIECCDKAIEINPRFFAVWNTKGDVFYKLERYQEAIECFEKFIDFAPRQDTLQIEQVKQIVEKIRR